MIGKRKYLIILLCCLHIFIANAQSQLCPTSTTTAVFFEDFGSGTALYGPQLAAGLTNYPYVTGFPPNGSYVISSNSDPSGATSYQGDYIQHVGDHTGNPNGYMMVVNADYPPSTVYTRHVTGLTPNTTYVFSAYLSNNDDPTVNTIVCAGSYIYANVKFQVEYPTGNVIGSVSSGNLPLSSSLYSLNWQQYGFVFTTGAMQTSADVVMINNAPGGCGNDYTVDDISLSICCTNFINNSSRDTSICTSSTATLTAETAQSYTWSTGSNNPSITINNDGTYWVQLQPQNGCKRTDTIHVTFNAPPVIDILKDTSVCSNANYVLNASPANAISYNWSTGASGPSITPFNSDIYWVDMNINSCMVRDSSTISILPTPIATANDYTVCNGQALTITPFISGGSGSYTYNWGNGFTASSYSTMPVADSLYSVQVTDTNGCSVPWLTGHITVLVPLNITANNIKTCTNDTVKLYANASGGNGNYAYTWMPSGTHQNPLIFVAQNNLIYTVTVSDGCSANNASDTANIEITQAPTIVLPNAVSGCRPVCIDLSSTPYSTLNSWKWNFGDSNSSTVAEETYCYNKSGNYNISLTYTTNLGCAKAVNSGSIVTVFSSPDAAFTASSFTTDIFDMNINFYNETSGYSSLQWDFGDGIFSSEQDPSHLYSSTGNYYVVLIAESNKGCRDTVIHEIIINDVFTFYAPNTFSPDDDELNDVFLPTGTGWDNNSFKMQVFDRWGNLVLATANPYQGWDGKIKGRIAQQDTYVWKAELKDVFGKQHAYNGVINLIK